MSLERTPIEKNNGEQKDTNKNDLSKLVEKTKKQNEVLKKIIEKINAPEKTKKTK